MHKDETHDYFVCSPNLNHNIDVLDEKTGTASDFEMLQFQSMSWPLTPKESKVMFLKTTVPFYLVLERKKSFMPQFKIEVLSMFGVQTPEEGLT